MSKGTISGETGEGLYSVTTNPDNSCIDSEIIRLQAKIPDIEADISAKEIEVAALLVTKDEALVALDATITAFSSVPPTATAAQVVAAEKTAREAVGSWQAGKRELAAVKLELMTLRVEVARLTNAKLPEETGAMWCADLTEELTGEVGLVNLPDGSERIQPGYDGNSVYSYTRDGVFVSPEGVGQATAYLFWALDPCVQRHKPLFRTGTVTAVDLDADTVDVTLDAATSDKGLNLNISGSYTAVPVEYMACNAGAFEEGDDVIIQFDGDATTPKVIGFSDNPKPCPAWGFTGWVRGDTGINPLLSQYEIAGKLSEEIRDVFLDDTARIRITAAGRVLTDLGGGDWEWSQEIGGWLHRYSAYIYPATDCDSYLLLFEWAFEGAGNKTFKLEINTVSGWVTRINALLNPADGDFPFGSTDFNLCLAINYTGDSWAVTGEGVWNSDPDTITWIAVT